MYHTSKLLSSSKFTKITNLRQINGPGTPPWPGVANLPLCSEFGRVTHFTHEIGAYAVHLVLSFPIFSCFFHSEVNVYCQYHLCCNFQLNTCSKNSFLIGSQEAPLSGQSPPNSSFFAWLSTTS